ncbi:MAG TPA: radical SAM protein, partial [Thermoanaerobaculia bacterium]
MRTLLLFPPAADPAHPPLGIAALAGFLCEKGEETGLLDLNIRAYNELLSADSLMRCGEELQRRLDNFESRPELKEKNLAEYAAVAENLLSADWLIERIDGARRRLRDPAAYVSRRGYAEVTSIIRRAMQLISAAHYPAQWSAGGFSTSHQATRSAEVLAAIDDRRQNLFLPVFEAALPEIVAQHPRIVGISLNYRVQTIPAMILAAMVRKALPDAYIVVGGGMICFFEQHWDALAPFRHLVDGWIPFEGEKPLFDLIQSLKRGDQPDRVAGLLRFEQEVPLYHPPGPPASAAELPPPRFDGLVIDEYLAPEPILPLLASRGCYWGRCAFCAHGHVYRERFRTQSAASVLETVDHLSKRYGAKCFYFVDEAIPPRTALTFADMIIAGHRPYRWFSEARFERAFDAPRLKRLHEGGCRMLIFGLESGVPRVLDLMEKGIDLQHAAAILRACTAAGIRTFVMFFVGFPSETRDEAARTLRFVEEHRESIDHMVSGQFVLEPHSPVFHNRERYGVTEVFPYPDDLKTWSQYHVGTGMTSSEAGQLAAEIELLPMMKSPDFHLISR